MISGLLKVEYPKIIEENSTIFRVVKPTGLGAQIQEHPWWCAFEKESKWQSPNQCNLPQALRFEHAAWKNGNWFNRFNPRREIGEEERDLILVSESELPSHTYRWGDAAHGIQNDYIDAIRVSFSYRPVTWFSFICIYMHTLCMCRQHVCTCMSIWIYIYIKLPPGTSTDYEHPAISDPWIKAGHAHSLEQKYFLPLAATRNAISMVNKIV